MSNLVVERLQLREAFQGDSLWFAVLLQICPNLGQSYKLILGNAILIYEDCV